MRNGYNVRENLMASLVGEGLTQAQRMRKTPRGRILLPWEREVRIF